MELRTIVGIFYSLFIYGIFLVFLHPIKYGFIISLLSALLFFIFYKKESLRKYFGALSILFSMPMFIFSFYLFVSIPSFSVKPSIFNSVAAFLIFLIGCLFLYSGIIILKYKENYVERWIKRMTTKKK